MNNDEVPSLFWSRPKIIAPPRPKSKVTKTVEAWISIYPGGMKMFHWNEPVYCGLNCIACVHLTGTYEVFEQLTPPAVCASVEGTKGVGVRTIGLPNGYVVIVDDCDYNTVSPFKWSADVQRFADGRLRTVYARRNVLVDGRWTPQIMHRVISGAGPGQIVDHIDGDGLNNRRNNLRLCTTKENRRNMRPRVDGSSKFKGVSWNSARSKWSAHIKFGNKQKCLGQFMSEIDAARSYDAAAKEYFGDFARLNFGLTIPTVYENVEETNGVVYVYQG